MRHKSIILIFGALLLHGCDRKVPQVKESTQLEPVATETIQEEQAFEPAPEASAAPPAAIVPVPQEEEEVVVPEQREEEAYQEEIYQEEVPEVLVDEEIVIQAEEESQWPKNKGKTYNELQFSDDEDDYPFTPNSEGRSYNYRNDGGY